jgi:hypothetical protein
MMYMGLSAATNPWAPPLLSVGQGEQLPGSNAIIDITPQPVSVGVVSTIDKYKMPLLIGAVLLVAALWYFKR